jgi:transcriptional regulator GlxA family with amidase domain
VTRRQFTAAALGAGIGVPLTALQLTKGSGQAAPSPLPKRPLPLPPDGLIRTAVAIGPGTNVIDLAGPWEVFQDSGFDGSSNGRFELFTVAVDTNTIEASGGLTIQPHYSYDTAPDPHLVVIPAHGSTDQTIDWLRDVGRRADLVMSVCTGAFVLARTGLLDGKTATTHHGSYDDFEATFPAIKLVRGRRFVEHDRVATAGGLTSGIDLALRVVERYLGMRAATATARYMEYVRRQNGVKS